MSQTCWDLAIAAAGHHDGASGLHPQPRTPHELFQVSTAAALVAGAFTGSVTYGDIRHHGDFGLGTFDALDGEMIALDGEFHQLHSDGSTSVVREDQRAPFALVTFFRGDALTQVTTPIGYDQMLSLLDDLVPSESPFYAIRVDGLFESVVTRTVSRQQPPFPPLAQATAGQVEVTMNDVSGSLIGFRAPDYANGVTIGGYHFHFITDDRTAGGHVLDCRLANGVIHADQDCDFHVELPSTESARAVLPPDQMAAAIDAAERSRHGAATQ